MMFCKLKTTAMLLVVSGAMWFAGCSSSSPNQIVVTVSPSSALAVAGTVATFSATVTGSTNLNSSWTCSYSYLPAPTTAVPNPKAVTGTCTSGLSLNGGNLGSWTTNQSTTDNVLTYTAPTLSNFPNPIPTLTFAAASQADNKKTGTATITLDTGIRISVTPPSATAPVGLTPAQQIQFTANLGPNNTPAGLTWLVTQPVTGDTTDFPNGAAPGAPTCSPNCGSISNVGVYTAPATVPADTFPKSSGSNAATAAITVTVVANSPSDTAHFATATITLVNASTNPITFSGITPTTTAAGGILQDVFLNAHNILNTTTITFTPPGAGQNPQAIDPSSIFTIPITSNYCTPSASGVTPVVTCDASILTRIRLDQAQLAEPGTGQITVNNIPGSATATAPCTATANTGGNTTNISCPIDLVYASPAMVTAVPDSFPQGNNSSFTADGGFYGGGNSPIVNLLFDGNLNIASSFNARQFTGPLQSSQIQTPGLFPVSVVSNAPIGGQGDLTPPPFPQVWANVAIQPTFTGLSSTYFSSATPPTQIALPPAIPLAVSGSNTNLAPSSMALDSAKGYAVITEQANNSIQIINLTTVGSNGRVVPQMQGVPIAVGHAPTSIAIDNQINLQNFPGQDLGVVVNSGDNTLTLVALPSGTIIGSPVSLAGLIPGTTPPSPYAVGVDPNTHYAVVALSNSNIGYIADVNPSGSGPTCFNATLPSPPCAIATVSLNTGTTPQVVMQPDAPLGYVTPGGSGVTSVVNLLQTNQSVAIAAAPNGAVRTNNVVTITSNVPNGLNQANPGTVLVAGVNPPDFNGTFNVLTASTYTFTYTQNGANETGGGGSVTFGNPYYTFSTTSTATGAAINPITRTFAFADPNASRNSQIGFIHTLDQTVTSLSLTKGSCNGCTPNPAGVPEPGVRFVSWDPYTNVLVAYNPQDNFNEISLINPGGPTSNGTVGSYRIIQGIQTGQTGTGSYTPSGSTTPVTVYGPMAYDPKTNLVLVANAGSNTLTYLDVDPGSTFKKVAIQDIQLQLVPNSGGVPSSQPPLASVQNPPPVATCDPTNPTNIYAACLPHGVTVGQPALLRVLGQGFTSGGSPTVRLDGDPTGVTITTATDSEIDITITASRLSVPHDFALDVLTGTTSSNVSQLYAVQVTPLAACGSAATPAQPEGVAIDDIRNVAVVTNYGCNTISFISLDSKNAHNYGVAYGSVLSSFPTGNNPVDVAVIPRLGYAVVTNKTDGTVTIVNMSNPLSPSAATGSPVTVGVAPLGVAIDQDRALALVANSGGNSLSSIDLTTLLEATPVAPPMQLVPVSGPPTAIAVDPNRAEAVVTNIQNTGRGVTGGLDVITLSGTVPTKSTTASITSLTANPTGIVYDPAVNPALFYATSTQQNAVYAFNPDTAVASPIRVGINPYSIAYNYQTGTILTVNSTSNTMSVIDSQNFTTRDTLGITSQSQFAAAVDNTSNTAVIADQNNNRVLILGLPR